MMEDATLVQCGTKVLEISCVFLLATDGVLIERGGGGCEN